MDALNRLSVSPSRMAGRGLLWRSLLAAPFVLALVLTLVLGPSTVNSTHGSFTWLAVLSAIIALLMFGATAGLLIPAGLVAFLAFPLLAGLGFSFAPAWARPLVAVIFYSSLLASAAAWLTGIVHVLRAFLARRRGAIVIGMACLALLAAAAAMVSLAPAPARATAPAPGSLAGPMDMGAIINTGQREAEPSFTADGRTMIFNCHNADICISSLTGTWEGAQWTAPRLIGPPVSSAYHEVEPWLNAAGDRLYFNSTRPFAKGESLPGLALYVDALGRLSSVLGIHPLGGLGQDDIWVSELKGGVWSEPRNLKEIPGEPPVNTEYMDHCLSFSADGSEAFWTSTRPGGFGGNDIWTSRRVGGKWTEPENLGPNVNSPGSEHHSIPTPDGRSLYVTSDRAGGFGGEDIYITTRDAAGKWGPLVNVGPPVNGPGNDRCPAWTPDQKIWLFDSDRAGSFGSKDIWWLYAKDVPLRPATAG